MAGLLAASRAWLLRRVRNGTSTVAAFQRMCGVSIDAKKASASDSSEVPEPIIRNSFFYYLFLTAAAAGNELFYIIVLPALFWLVNVDLARRIVMLWWIVYFVGQSAKDLLCLPRPPSPPVAKLERHYETEYGFPSTHAMVSLTLPLYSLFALDNLGVAVNWPLGLTLCAIWCATITCSRLYVGVHSPCDLVGGLLFGALVLAIGLVIGEPVDAFVFAHPLGPLLAVLVSLLLVWSYPAPQAWTNAYGDTALIIAVVAGVCCGQSAFFTRHPAIALTVAGHDWPSLLHSLAAAALAIMARLVVGCTILFLTRSFAKKLSMLAWLPFVLPRYFAYCSLLPSPDASPRHSPRSSPRPSHKKAPSSAKRASPEQAQLDDTEESGVWELTPMSDVKSRKAPSPPPATTTIAPRPVAPRQFRLSIDVAVAARARPTPTPSPLSALLSRIPSPAHTLLPDPLKSGPTLVEYQHDGRSVVINPLHVYLVEIPIKYFTYWAVGFNATCLVPYIFHMLGL